MATYKALVSLDNREGKHFEPGDPVSESDFPKYVLTKWVEAGRVEFTKNTKSQPETEPGEDDAEVADDA